MVRLIALPFIFFLPLTIFDRRKGSFYVYRTDRRLSFIQNHLVHMGLFLEQAELYQPDVIRALRRLLDAGEERAGQISR